MKIYDFTVEYQDTPKGLAVRKPRLSWKLQSDRENTLQESYSIEVKENETVVWSTGEVISDKSVLVPYEGEALKEETTYEVYLSVKTNHGETENAYTTFQTGIFDGKSFEAKMITHDFPEDETACPVFYKKVQIDKPVLHAYAYATAHGVYELSVNGQKAGEEFMSPGWTSYHKRLQYQFYDITELLAEENEIALTVGNGWYKGILGFDCKPNRYGDRVEVFAEIHILFEDGSTEVVATDETWGVRTGEIRYSEIYMGEIQDTDQPETRDGKVSEVPFDKSLLCAQESEPVRVTQRFQAKRVFVDP